MATTEVMEGCRSDCRSSSVATKPEAPVMMSFIVDFQGRDESELGGRQRIEETLKDAFGSRVISDSGFHGDSGLGRRTDRNAYRSRTSLPGGSII